MADLEPLPAAPESSSEATDVAVHLDDPELCPRYVASVADDFLLADAFSVPDLEMVYSRDDTATLFEIDDRTYTIELKP